MRGQEGGGTSGGHAGTPLLALRNLSKHFGGEKALDGASLFILPGESHGLLGENGSGKSTLIKVLAGYFPPEPGSELEIHGERVPLPLSPGQFRRYGVSFVHQDLGLVPDLSVLENLMVGEMAGGHRRWFISWPEERKRAEMVFSSYGVAHIDPRMRVRDLKPVDRALLAIVRAAEEVREEQEALGRKGLLVLDEPTVFLPKKDIDRLFRLIRDIVSDGASVLFVSHDLDEVREITDRVTVLRDGRVHGAVRTADATKDLLVEMIIGRQLDRAHLVDDASVPDRPVAASVEELASPGLQQVSFDVYRGEVLGLTGVVGSGFEDLPYVLFGATPPQEGRLRIEDRDVDLRSLTPAEAIRSRIALLPADRQRDGSIPSLSLLDNVSMQVLARYFEGLRLRSRRMVADSTDLLGRFRVRPNRPDLPYASLSGGNQQKALLAKWLRTDPLLLLLHEPTQGVDVGARLEIFSMIRSLALEGTSVLCASSDHEQLAEICDRVLIFGQGGITRELVGGAITKEEIARWSYAA